MPWKAKERVVHLDTTGEVVVNDGLAMSIVLGGIVRADNVHAIIRDNVKELHIRTGSGAAKR